jgi:hypothetical protein
MNPRDRYQVIGRLGSGGFGVVYLARHQRADVGYERRVAIKVLAEEHTHPAVVERFRHEARLLGRIQHSAVVKGGPPIWLARWTSGVPSRQRPKPFAAFVMDFVPGAPLSRWTDVGRTVPPAVALRVIGRVAEVMHQVHHQTEDGSPLGVIHRDLKPSNVMIGRGGDIHLLDLGIARANLSFILDRKATVGLVGTPGYIAPEQLQGLSTPVPAMAGDVYALGVMLHELVTGWHPEVSGERPVAADLAPVVAFASLLRSANPSARPSFREVARQAASLADGYAGPSLVTWCEDDVPAEAPVTQDGLAGVTLVEVDPPEPPTPETEAAALRGAEEAGAARAGARWRRPSIFIGLAGIGLAWLAWSRSSMPVPGADPTAAVEQAGTAQAEPVNVSYEPTTSGAGQFPEVMQFANCVGVIIGPHALLTHAACLPHPTSMVFRGPGEPGGETRITVTTRLLSPYTAPAFWPVETVDEGDPAGGGAPRFPESINLQVLFVPEMTPAFLRARGIVPATLSANPALEEVVAVTVLAGEEPRRAWAPMSVPEQATLPPAAPGARSLVRWTCAREICPDEAPLGGATFDVSGADHVLLGLARPSLDHEGPSIDAGWQAMAPLAPLDVMTPSQLEAARVNLAWVQHAIADFDLDGVPTPCDLTPLEPGTPSSSCPQPVGGPGREVAVGVRGRLSCPPGYVATGIRGGEGDLVDRLALQCRPSGCLVAGRGRCRELWTSDFGGRRGAAFTSTCREEEVLTGLTGSVFASTAASHSGWLGSARVACAPARRIREGGEAATEPPVAGWWGVQPQVPYAARCAAGTAVVGLELRAVDRRFVSGLQVLCSAEPAHTTSWVGGIGGRDEAIVCPSGAVAVGTVQAPLRGFVGLFGLVCVARSTAGSPAEEPIVVHGNFDADDGSSHPGRSWRLSEFRKAAPTEVTFTRCPAGARLSGLDLHVRLLISSVDRMVCTDAAGREVESIAVGIGSPEGTAHEARCGDRPVTGMVVSSSGWFEGISLACGE